MTAKKNKKPAGLRRRKLPTPVSTVHKPHSNVRSKTKTGSGKAKLTKNQDKAGVKARKEAFLEEYIAVLCNITVACERLGISRRVVYHWRTADPEFRKEMDELQEVRIDFVENALDKNIRDGNVTAQIFFLKTIGKKRGYIERSEITGADGGPMNVLRGEIPDEALQSAFAKVIKDHPDIVVDRKK